MPAVFKATLIFFTQQLSVQLSYRMAFFQVALFEAAGLASTVFYWRAAATGGRAGYSATAIVVYFIVASAHQILQESGISRSLSLDIRSGKLAVSLVRPFPFLIQPFTQAMAWSLSRFVMIFPVLVAIFLLIPSLRDFFADVAQHQGGVRSYMLSWLIGLALAMACNLVVRIGLGLLAFDMTQTWGPELLFISVFFAFSGVVYPVDLLPPAVVDALSWTPLFYMQGFPNLFAIGRIAPDAWWFYIGRGFLVLTFSSIAVMVLWLRGLRKFEAVGI
jgi:ABC-2 type transport system permease protein